MGRFGVYKGIKNDKDVTIPCEGPNTRKKQKKLRAPKERKGEWTEKLITPASFFGTTTGEFLAGKSAFSHV